jgi:hypothetical protein
VDERIADATKGVAGMIHVSGTVQSIASTPNNLQSISDAGDTSSAILGPLKVFSSVANEIAEVRAFISTQFVTDDVYVV